MYSAWPFSVHIMLGLPTGDSGAITVGFECESGLGAVDVSTH